MKLIKSLSPFLVVLALAGSQSSYAMLAETQTAPEYSNSGAVRPVLTNKPGDLFNAERSAHYQSAVLRGNVYIGADLGGTSVTTQAGLSATTPALTLYNPVGSNTNLVLWIVDAGVTAAPAAAAGFMIAVSSVSTPAPTATTAATVISVKTGGLANPVGQCYRVATLASAPLMIRYLWGTTGAAAISGVPYSYNLDGSIVVVPGEAISIQTTSAAAVLASFTWEEVPQ